MQTVLDTEPEAFEVTCYENNVWEVPASWPSCPHDASKSLQPNSELSLKKQLSDVIWHPKSKPKFVKGGNCGITGEVTTLQGKELPETLDGLGCVKVEW